MSHSHHRPRSLDRVARRRIERRTEELARPERCQHERLAPLPVPAGVEDVYALALSPSLCLDCGSVVK